MQRCDVGVLVERSDRMRSWHRSSARLDILSASCFLVDVVPWCLRSVPQAVHIRSHSLAPVFFFLVSTQKKQFKPNYIWGKNSFPPQLFLLDLQLAYAWIKSTSFRCTASVVVFVKMSAGIIPVGTWWAPIRPLSVNSVQNHLRRCGCLVHAEYPFNLWKRRKVLQSSRFRCCFFRIHWTWAHVVGSWTWQTYFMQTV